MLYDIDSNSIIWQDLSLSLLHTVLVSLKTPPSTLPKNNINDICSNEMDFVWVSSRVMSWFWSFYFSNRLSYYNDASNAQHTSS